MILGGDSDDENLLLPSETPAGARFCQVGVSSSAGSIVGSIHTSAMALQSHHGSGGLYVPGENVADDGDCGFVVNFAAEDFLHRGHA